MPPSSRIPGGDDGGGTETNFASADPTFSVASNFANPEAYSFVFSPGIGDTPAVPELASTAMLIADLLMVARGIQLRP